MIYCPQCGSGINETTRFCRNCGLPLNDLMNYVASGGTAPLQHNSAHQSAGPGFFRDLTPKQQLVLLILGFVLAPGLISVFSAIPGMGLAHLLVPLCGILMIPGIIWAVFRYQNQVRRGGALQGDARPPAPEQLQTSSPEMSLPARGTNMPAQAPSRGSIIEHETQKLPDHHGQVVHRQN